MSKENKMKNFIEKERKARAKRRFKRAKTLIKRDWSKINDFPVWILTPSGVALNLASQSTALDMNQGTPSYPSLQNQAHQCFVTKDEADRANRPEIEAAQVDPARQVEQLASELKSVVQQADRLGQKVVAVSLRVEFAT
jgi:exodeoxyribonuclease V gamma chain